MAADLSALAAGPTAILADDEPALLRYLGEQLQRAWPALRVVACAANGVEAAAAIERELPDFAFLDIHMPGLNGLQVAQGIESARTRVVFVTAYDQHAIEAFERGAIDYLLKPVTDERLARTVARLQALNAAAQPSDQALARIAELLRDWQRQAFAPPQPRADGRPGGALVPPPSPAGYLRWVRASVGELTYHIDVAEVLYFDAAEKYTCVVTAQGERLIRVPIGELEAQLDPQRFARIHRSTIVNLEHVHATRRDDSGKLYVRLRNHRRELPVSRAYHMVFGRM